MTRVRAELRIPSTPFGAMSITSRTMAATSRLPDVSK